MIKWLSVSAAKEANLCAISTIAFPTSCSHSYGLQRQSWSIYSNPSSLSSNIINVDPVDGDPHLSDPMMAWIENPYEVEEPQENPMPETETNNKDEKDHEETNNSSCDINEDDEA